MIGVWNSHDGKAFVFKDLDAYKAFARAHRDEHDYWSDAVHDVGDGGEMTGENQLDMIEFKVSLSNERAQGGQFSPKGRFS